MKKKAVLNSFISIGSVKEFIDEIFSLVREKVPSYVCFANVHMVMEGYNDSSFQRVINQANVTAPDGKPISLFIKFFERIKQARVCGMDLMPSLLKEAEVQGKSVFFYGSTDELLKIITIKAKKEFPHLKIGGSFSPPFRKLTELENDNMIKMIREVSPDLIFVSLGCPKQEKWMAENRDKLGACLLGVGQAFKVYAGIEKRLPVWLRNLSLEWLYRFYLEPKRLWKRYLLTNSYFLFLTFNHMIFRFLAPFVKGTMTEPSLHGLNEQPGK
jgi:N-acetylglucosaminyldiphosphoundecaprenol N-acetyl-beta-D-mannosaminyltransferase